MRIAIVSTAGRGDDGHRHRLTGDLWRAMQADAHKQVEGERNATGITAARTTFVSGGAPRGRSPRGVPVARRLGRFARVASAGRARCARLRSRQRGWGVHDAFRARLGVASVDALLAAVAQGTRVSNGGDFAAREAAVAATAEVVKACNPRSNRGGLEARTPRVGTISGPLSGRRFAIGGHIVRTRVVPAWGLAGSPGTRSAATPPARHAARRWPWRAHPTGADGIGALRRSRARSHPQVLRARPSSVSTVQSCPKQRGL